MLESHGNTLVLKTAMKQVINLRRDGLRDMFQINTYHVTQYELVIETMMKLLF
jgi:hypothetical protein